jgi:hypothetical protein
MKAIAMRIQKFSRAGVILLATVVAIITSVVVANATQTITTPNAAFIPYNLAAGANSAAITPATSRSVLVMGCCTTTSVQGVGQVSLQHIPSAGFSWTGLESFGPSAVTGGSSATTGTHIVSIDAGQIVEIQVAGIDTIRIHNGSGAARAGNVTLVW